MPFTALNDNAAPPKDTLPEPSWLREDFKELKPDALKTIAALWNAHSINQHEAQSAILNLKNLVTDLRGQFRSQSATTTIPHRAESPSRKRAREDNDKVNGHTEKQARISETQSSVSGSWKGAQFDGVSFTIPQRKKLSLTISSAKNEGILVTGAGADTPEFGIPWTQVENVLCLPVPEKTQPQKSFVVFPRGVEGLSEMTDSSFEPIVFTVPDTKAKGAADDEPTQAQAIKTAFEQSFKILEPDPEDFTSEIPPAGGKKGDKAYHIKAFKGSKDGFLFLLPTGIIWAFKKPLIFFSFSSIDSISYTSVLQRTFNLVISARPSSTSPSATNTPATEYEFSMLDQADFAGIDEYVKKNGLQDASLAEQRRAKVYNVNGKKGDAEGGEEGDGDGEDGAGSGVGELEKAQREADAVATAKDGVEDSDDEEDDENFDPGSEGDSEGSGSGSGSEDEDEDGGDGDGDGDGEDVEMSDAEDKG